MKYFIQTLILVIPVFLMSCSGSYKQDVASITVKKQPFTVIISAFGELEAVKSTPVQAPENSRGAQTIAWMIPENSIVKKDDVLIRFDSKSAETSAKQELFQIDKLEYDIDRMKNSLNKEKKELNTEVILVNLEKQLAEAYIPDNEALYSKNEIIEATANLDYLKAKDIHFRQKVDKQDKKAKTELQLLDLKKKTHEVKYDQNRDTINALELKAPHDGLFVYKKNWRGEKPKVGMSVWRGMELGELPDLNSMQAKIHILESEASGLKEGLAVTMSLDSNPEKLFHGKITMFDTIAKPIERNSPLKYFQATVTLDNTDSSFMKPGNQLKAEVFVEKINNVLSIPNQAIFSNNDMIFVYVKNGNRFRLTEVETGSRSLTKTVITKGIQEGDTIALGNPDRKEL